MASPVQLNSSFEYTISETEASFSKKGQILAKGRSMTRLKLGPDSRFYVAAKVVKSDDFIGYIIGKIGTLFNNYVEIKNVDETIFVSIDSFSNRLLVSKTKIQEAAKAGTLPLLLNQRMERTIPIISGYQKFIDKFGYDTAISLQMMKVIRTTVKTEQPIYKDLTIEEESYQLGFDKEKKEVELLSLGAVFASGTYGAVRTITNIFNDIVEIFKQAKSDIDIKQQAIADVKNEYDQLRAIHAKGKVWGIQAPPRQIVQIKEGLTEQYGHIGLKYDRDYFDDVFYTNVGIEFNDRLIAFHQILSGAKELAARNIIHGDLKLENILVKDNDDGTQLVHLADLGGARFVPDTPPLDLKKLAGSSGDRSFTHTTSPLEDLLLSGKLANEGKFKELVELEKKRDVFSIGCILFQAITGNNPYRLTNTKYGEYYDLSHYFGIYNPNVPQEMKNLIKKMLDPDHIKRPTAQEAFAVYEDFLRAKNPNILKQIEEKIQLEKYLGSVS